MSENAIELKGISKYFGSVVANKNINLSAKKGQILSLLGENGSGKTTLMNMLSGIYKPDEGEIYVNGELVSIQSPEDAKHLGIGMVHQHFKLVDSFSAADNIWIGAETENEVFLSKNRYKKIKELSTKYGFDIDPEKKVADMSVSEKQTVEILKVLYYGAKILILDEPTAVLTPQEISKLFRVFKAMKKSGCSIIIITHKLNEVMEISDRVTVLRKGESIATVNTAETNEQKLTELMVGRPVELSIDCPKYSFDSKDSTLLNVHHLSIEDNDGVTKIDDISFELNRGEILGVAGVAGSGQKELCEAITGLQKIKKGAILYKKENIEGKTPKDIIDLGISMSFIPEDRLGMGLAASLDITDNMMLKTYSKGKSAFVDRKSAANLATRLVDELEISTPSINTPVRRLSGGNVQKVLLGREIEAEPSVLITAYPVRGLDINSSYTIYNLLNEQKKKGTGILFVGEDLDVMMSLCDRIMVLCHGKITGIVDAQSITKEELGLLMTDAYSNKEKISNETKELPQLEAVSEVQKQVKKHKAPLIRMAKRDELTPLKSSIFYAFAILLALIMGGIFIAASGVNPFKYYGTMFVGCFKNSIYLKGFLSIVTPLLITSLGISVAFKMKFWNIGANGQFIMGAVFAATIGLLFDNTVPRPITLIIMLAAGIIGGGFFAFIPAYFKVKYKTNETLLTLMLNYIALYFLSYLKNTMFFRKIGENGQIFRPDFKKLPENAWMYNININGVVFDISLIIGILLVIALFIYFKKTKQGYEISVVGDSQSTALYAGMNVPKIIFRTIFLSGAIVGMAGMMHVSGLATSYTLADGITSDVGWTGITVAWLAKLNPFGILITSGLMGILQKGSAVAESTYDISSSASSVLQGIILFTVLAADFFTRYKIVFRHSKS